VNGGLELVFSDERFHIFLGAPEQLATSSRR